MSRSLLAPAALPCRVWADPQPVGPISPTAGPAGPADEPLRAATRGWARWAGMAACAIACWASPSGALAQAAAAAGATSDADCTVAWQVDVLPEGPGRVLQVHLSFDAGQRQRSTLRLPGGWAAVDDTADTPAGPRLQAVPDEPTLRSVAHNAGQRVHLRWRHRLAGPADERWWVFGGHTVLPLPDELDIPPAGSACIGMSGPAMAEGSLQRWLSSHGLANGPSALWRLPLAGGNLRSRVQQALYAGGDWQVITQVVDGQTLTVVRPDSPALGITLPALAQAGSVALAAQRRHWGDAQAGLPLMLWALPLPGTPGADAPTEAATHSAPIHAWGSAWHQTALVQAQAGPALPAATLDGAVTQALHRLWLLSRFGPLVQAGRDDEALRRWFSDGVADFLAHQALLRDQRWSADDLARHYQRQIGRWGQRNPPGPAATDPAALDAAAARGEWLALQWHALLRAQGQPGLDALLRRQLLPAAQARREGPISAPLATHRLVAALRARLGDHPLREVQRVVDHGEPVWVYPDTLGPCFERQAPGDALRVQARPQALQQAACQGWLGLGPQAGAAVDNLAQAPTQAPTQALADKPAPQAAKVRGGKAPARATGKAKGKAGAKASGRAGSKASGKATGRSTGKSAGKSTGKSAGKSAGKSSSKATGKARKR